MSYSILLRLLAQQSRVSVVSPPYRSLQPYLSRPRPTSTAGSFNLSTETRGSPSTKHTACQDASRVVRGQRWRHIRPCEPPVHVHALLHARRGVLAEARGVVGFQPIHRRHAARSARPPPILSLRRVRRSYPYMNSCRPLSPLAVSSNGTAATCDISPVNLCPVSCLILLLGWHPTVSTP